MPKRDRDGLQLIIPDNAYIAYTCPECGKSISYCWMNSNKETEPNAACSFCGYSVMLLLPGQRICGACKGEGITLHAPCAGADVSESQTGPCSRCYGKGYV